MDADQPTIVQAVATRFDGEPDFYLLLRLPDGEQVKKLESRIIEDEGGQPVYLKQFWAGVDRDRNNCRVGEVIEGVSIEEDGSSSDTRMSLSSEHEGRNHSPLSTRSGSTAEPEERVSKARQHDEGDTEVDVFSPNLRPSRSPEVHSRRRPRPASDDEDDYGTSGRSPSRRSESSTDSESPAPDPAVIAKAQARKAMLEKREVKRRRHVLVAQRALLAAEDLPPPSEDEHEPTPIPVKARFMNLSESTEPSASDRSSIVTLTSETTQPSGGYTILVHSSREGKLVEKRFSPSQRTLVDPRRRSTDEWGDSATADEDEVSAFLIWDRSSETRFPSEPFPSEEPKADEEDLPDFEDVEDSKTVDGRPDGPESSPVRGPSAGSDISDPFGRITGPLATSQTQRWKPPQQTSRPVSVYRPGFLKAPPKYSGLPERERFRVDITLPQTIVSNVVDTKPTDPLPAFCVHFTDFSYVQDATRELNDVLRDVESIVMDDGDLYASRDLQKDFELVERFKTGSGMAARVAVVDGSWNDAERDILRAIAHQFALDKQYCCWQTKIPDVKLVLFSSQDQILCDALLIPRTLRYFNDTLLICRLILPDTEDNQLYDKRSEDPFRLSYTPS